MQTLSINTTGKIMTWRKTIFNDWSRVLGASLLVSGTCIGAGMLGLPVSTAAGGMMPTMCLFVIIWLLMTFSALVMLEVSLWFKGETNLISMAKHTLGKKGEMIAWVTYVVFLYCLMGAYTASGSALFGQGVSLFTGISLFKQANAFIYTGMFALVVFMGAKYVDYLNRFLIAGLVVAYFLLITYVTPHVETAKLLHAEPRFLMAAIPLMVTSFGFHLLIPSLKSYLKEDVLKLRTAIIFGGMIPFMVYFVWELVILGVVPVYGENSLTHMLQIGEPVVPLTQALDLLIGSSVVSVVVRAFTFFAVVSSFIGVALGLFDFFADGAHIKKNVPGKLLLAIMTFLPPLLFALFYPQGFVLALSYAGVFAAILLILYPVLMAKYGRNMSAFANAPYKVKGGNVMLNIAIFASISVIIIELLADFHILPMPF